jgi:hypothetical protein
VAVVAYSIQPTIVLGFDQGTAQALDRLDQGGLVITTGPTLLHASLELVRTRLLTTESAGFRNFEVPVHVVVVTDGWTLNSADVAAELAHPLWTGADGRTVTRIVVGVGAKADTSLQQQQMMASLLRPTEAAAGGVTHATCAGPSGTIGGNGMQRIVQLAASLNTSEGFAPCSTTATSTATSTPTSTTATSTATQTATSSPTTTPTTTTATSTATSTVTSSPGLCRFDGSAVDVVIIRDGAEGGAADALALELTRLLPKRGAHVRLVAQFATTAAATAEVGDKGEHSLAAALANGHAALVGGGTSPATGRRRRWQRQRRGEDFSEHASPAVAAAASHLASSNSEAGSAEHIGRPHRPRRRAPHQRQREVKLPFERTRATRGDGADDHPSAGEPGGGIACRARLVLGVDGTPLALPVPCTCPDDCHACTGTLRTRDGSGLYGMGTTCTTCKNGMALGSGGKCIAPALCPTAGAVTGRGRFGLACKPASASGGALAVCAGRMLAESGGACTCKKVADCHSCHVDGGGDARDCTMCKNGALLFGTTECISAAVCTSAAGTATGAGSFGRVCNGADAVKVAQQQQQQQGVAGRTCAGTTLSDGAAGGCTCGGDCHTCSIGDSGASTGCTMCKNGAVLLDGGCVAAAVCTGAGGTLVGKGNFGVSCRAGTSVSGPTGTGATGGVVGGGGAAEAATVVPTTRCIGKTPADDDGGACQCAANCHTCEYAPDVGSGTAGRCTRCKNSRYLFRGTSPCVLLDWHRILPYDFALVAPWWFNALEGRFDGPIAQHGYNMHSGLTMRCSWWLYLFVFDRVFEKENIPMSSTF